MISDYIIVNGKVKLVGFLRKFGCINLEESVHTMIQQFEFSECLQILPI